MSDCVCVCGRFAEWTCALCVRCQSSLSLQLCLGAGGLHGDQDEQEEEEIDRLHSSSARLSEELSATLINLSEDPQSGPKSFILLFSAKWGKMFYPFFLV